VGRDTGRQTDRERWGVGEKGGREGGVSSINSRPKVIKLTPAFSTGLMAVSGSRQNVIKLTPALSNPTIPVGRIIERETGGEGWRHLREGGREEGVSSIIPTKIIGKRYGCVWLPAKKLLNAHVNRRAETPVG